MITTDDLGNGTTAITQWEQRNYKPSVKSFWIVDNEQVDAYVARLKELEAENIKGGHHDKEQS